LLSAITPHRAAPLRLGLEAALVASQNVAFELRVRLGNVRTKPMV
jgi:hypothetical protein